MDRTLRIRFIVVLIVTAVAAAIVAPFPGKDRVPFLSGRGLKPGMDLSGGAELRYELLFPPGFDGDRREATRTSADVARRRLDQKLLLEPRIHPEGEDGIVVQLPGVDGEGLQDCKRLLAQAGQLRLYAEAPPEVRQRYDREKGVPAGYREVKDRRGVGYLVEEEPVIEGKHLLDAQPQPDLSAGRPHWVTSFVLDAEGAKRFDAAAEGLYSRSPRGRMVVVLDGEVRSAPEVQSPAFHGRGQITASRE